MLRRDPPFEHSGDPMGTIWAPMSPQVDLLSIWGRLLKPFWNPVAFHRAPKATKNRSKIVSGGTSGNTNKIASKGIRNLIYPNLEIDAPVYTKHRFPCFQPSLKKSLKNAPKMHHGHLILKPKIDKNDHPSYQKVAHKASLKNTFIFHRFLSIWGT